MADQTSFIFIFFYFTDKNSDVFQVFQSSGPESCRNTDGGTGSEPDETCSARFGHNSHRNMRRFHYFPLITQQTNNNNNYNKINKVRADDGKIFLTDDAPPGKLECRFRKWFPASDCDRLNAHSRSGSGPAGTTRCHGDIINKYWGEKDRKYKLFMIPTFRRRLDQLVLVQTRPDGLVLIV